jgi:hypothetical protein
MTELTQFNNRDTILVLLKKGEVKDGTETSKSASRPVLGIPGHT